MILRAAPTRLLPGATFAAVFVASLTMAVIDRVDRTAQDLIEDTQRYLARDIKDLDVMASAIEGMTDVSADEFRTTARGMVAEATTVEAMLLTSETGTPPGLRDGLFATAPAEAADGPHDDQVIRLVEPRVPDTMVHAGRPLGTLIDPGALPGAGEPWPLVIVAPPGVDAPLPDRLVVARVIRHIPNRAGAPDELVAPGNVRSVLLTILRPETAFALHLDAPWARISTGTDPAAPAPARAGLVEIPVRAELPEYGVHAVLHASIAPIPAEVALALVIASGTGVLAWSVARVIAARREDYHTLRTRLEIATSGAEVGIWEYLPRTRLVAWDDTMRRMYGLPASGPVTYEDWSGALHPEDRADAEDAFGALIERDQRFDTRFRIVHPDGSVRHIRATATVTRDDRGKINRIIGANWDVSESAEALEGMNESQRVARLGNWSYDSRSGEITWSDQLYRLFNRDPALGPPSLQEAIAYYEPESGRRALEALDRSVNEGAPYSLNLEIRDPDNPVRHIRAEGRIRRDRDARVVGLYGTAMDITDAVRHERELEAERDRARAASRAKSEFLANMSHEIRTPMNAILGYADLLYEHQTAPGERTDEQSRSQTIHGHQEAARAIRANADHLLRVINDVLDMSKIEAGQMTTERILMPPADLVAEVVTLLAERARSKSVALTAEHDTPLPTVIQSDPTRLRQILLNIVGNAIKFTEDGSVTIRTAYDTKLQRITFRVIDTGIGMTPSQLETISRFEAFSQADTSMARRYGGTGLGLRISSSLAHMLGGKISAESVEHRGSTFTVEIAADVPDGAQLVCPVSQHAGPAPRRSAGDTPAARPNPTDLDGVRVLVAEDGLDNQRLIRHHLTKAGADVDIAANGQVAVDAYIQATGAGRAFHLILMDMQMPILDGYRATGQLRDLGCRTPVIALTAHAMTGDREKCLRAGCDDYISKPINYTELIEACQRALDHRSIAA